MWCGTAWCGSVWCGAVHDLVWSDLSCVTQLDHDDSDHALLAELGQDMYYMMPLTAEADELQPDETEELADGQRILWQRDGKKEPQAATVRTRAGCGDTSIAATKVLLLFSEPGESMMVRNARSHACARTVHAPTHAAPVHTSSHRHTKMGCTRCAQHVAAHNKLARRARADSTCTHTALAHTQL